jgi:hypothetical protein
MSNTQTTTLAVQSNRLKKAQEKEFEQFMSDVDMIRELSTDRWSHILKTQIQIDNIEFCQRIAEEDNDYGDVIEDFDGEDGSE